MAPESFNLFTTVESKGGIKFSSIFEPQVVFTFCVTKISFIAIGTPSSGLMSSLFLLRFSSIFLASRRADSSQTVIKAFKRGLSLCALSMYNFRSSVQLISLLNNNLFISNIPSLEISIKSPQLNSILLL